MLFQKLVLKGLGFIWAHTPPEDSLLARACRQWVAAGTRHGAVGSLVIHFLNTLLRLNLLSHTFTFMKWSQDYFSYIRLISYGTGGCKWSGGKPRQMQPFE